MSGADDSLIMKKMICAVFYCDSSTLHVLENAKFSR